MDLNTVLLAVQGAATIAICGTFWVYFRQLRVMEGQLKMMQHTSQFQELMEVIKILSESEMREARKVLMRNKGKAVALWTEEEITKAKKVCVYFEIIEILLKNRVIPEGVIEVHWGESIATCRAASEELVTLIRQTQNPDAFRQFDELCKRLKKRVSPPSFLNPD